jgi:membrane-associated protein
MTHLFNIPEIITTYGYLGIFIIIFLESGILFALPGDSLLFTAGLLAMAFGLNIYLLILITFLATFFGGMMGYEIGFYLVQLRNFEFFNKILKQEHLDKAHKFFDRYGKFAITFSRFVPIVRTFTPIVAGAARMNYRSFLKYSVIGSVLWSSIVTLLGFFLGHVFPQIKNYLWVVIVLVVLISAAPIIWEWLRGRKRG